MADTNMPAGGSPDKSTDPGHCVVDTDAISLEIERIRVLIDMAGERMNALCNVTSACDGVWLSFEEYLKGHLAAIERALADPAQAEPGDLPAMWREFKEADAAADAAHDEDGRIEQDDPAWVRFTAAREAIRSARPTDLAGLAVQVRLFQDVLDDSDPNEADEAMLAYVVGQLEAMAGEARS